MPITIAPVTPDFVAEVGDVDLTQPLSDADFDQLKAAFTRYAVLVFANQDLTPEQHLAFSRRWGAV